MKGDRILHIGRKTRQFDVLQKALVVVEHAGPAMPATMERLERVGAAIQRTPIDFESRSGNEHAGFAAFAPEPNRVYRVQGVHYVPQVVEIFVRANEAGLVEVIPPDLVNASLAEASATEAPVELTGGTEKMISYAISTRARLQAELTGAGAATALRSLNRIKSARRILAIKDLPRDALIAELTSLSPSTGPRPEPGSDT